MIKIVVGLCDSSMGVCYLVLIPEKKQTSHSFMTGGSSSSQSKVGSKSERLISLSVCTRKRLLSSL